MESSALIGDTFRLMRFGRLQFAKSVVSERSALMLLIVARHQYSRV
jgi:hypothetical protein